MNFLEKINHKMQKKESPDNPPPPLAVFWIETSESVSRQYQFELDGQLSVKIVDDTRPAAHRTVESFLNKFFPSGYPYSHCYLLQDCDLPLLRLLLLAGCQKTAWSM